MTALLAALMACTKMSPEVEPDGPAEEDGGRIITAVFGAASKSTLKVDGLTPKFRDGDLIKVSNITASQVCTIKVSGNVAFFKTTLTGALNAVYPEEAAEMNTAGTSITGVKIPSSQSGRFEKANIAMATIPAGGRHATFENQTAILRFYVDKSIGVSSLSIKTIGTTNIANDGADLKVIDVSPISGDISTLTADNPDPRICYIAILSGINANTLTFTSHTTTQDVVERVCPTNAVLKKSGMYDAFIPYYIDLGDAGKWAYCNLGAFLPEEVGCSFTWGATTGYRPASETTFEGGHSFVIGNDPLYNGTKYTKYTTGTGGDGKTVLESVDDAAQVNWGDSWRLPTGDNSSGDFHTLLASTYWLYVDDDKGCYVFLPSDYGTAGKHKVVTSIDETTKAKAKLFFPATGAGRHDTSSTVRERVDVNDGHYWTSWLNNSNNQEAWYMKITRSQFQSGEQSYGDATGLAVTSYYRYYGRSIRPVYSTLEFEIEKYNDPIDI